MHKRRPIRPEQGGPSPLRAAMIAGAILASYLLIVGLLGVPPREWAVGLTWISFQLLLKEVLLRKR